MKFVASGSGVSQFLSAVIATWALKMCPWLGFNFFLLLLLKCVFVFFFLKLTSCIL